MATQTSVIPIAPPPLPQGKPLFWKILILILITAVLGTVVMGIYFKYLLQDKYSDLLREQGASYVKLIANDLGYPPDSAAARRIASHHPVDIRIEGKGRAFATRSAMPSAREILEGTQPTAFDSGDSLVIRKHNNMRFGILSRGSWTYIVQMHTTSEGAMVVPATVLFCSALILLFTAAYYAVRRFLNPVKRLMEGVQRVGSGEFDTAVPIESDDELGELTRAFNAMSQQVSAIVASKRRLLFDVSHELRSPLTRMNVALAMLPEGKARISIERNIRELNIMITELLENERLAVLGGVLVIDSVDIVELAVDVIETFGHDRRRIEFDALTDSLIIRADLQRVKVAFRNVISNALKYSSDTPVRMSVFPDDNGARIVVADQGVGISSEDQAKVFEPFYRTDDSRSRATGGYGLGLSLTKSIVEAHGGTIRVDSVPGQGTTIMMHIPNVVDSSNVA
ncbi:MAG: HAMP domain-containing protein, partial [bacterium]|nr:HAMP domain-containing protein [Candidatus Kapabacteria bacterium]